MKKTVLLCLAVFSACIPDLGEKLPRDGSLPDMQGASDAGSDSGIDAAPIDASTDAGANDGSIADPLVAEGDTLFHTMPLPPFGDVGCAYCHCDDATGSCHFAAPNIVGASRTAIAVALKTVKEMSQMTATDHELDALSAYLASLAQNPTE